MLIGYAGVVSGVTVFCRPCGASGCVGVRSGGSAALHPRLIAAAPAGLVAAQGYNERF